MASFSASTCFFQSSSTTIFFSAGASAIADSSLEQPLANQKKAVHIIVIF
jgi:hypothetical protein